jgi:hypothetical protein
MPITFNCPCGKILSSRESDAGLKAICPSCGRRMIVPGQIQTPTPSSEKLRKAALEVDSWVHGHHRLFWQASLALGVLFVVAFAGYQYWQKGKRQEIVRNNLAHYSQPAEMKLNLKADPTLWHKSFDSFAVALKQSMAHNELMEDKFTGQTVDWVVTFDELLQRNSLYFREAEPLRHSDHGILVWATVLPSQIENAEKLVPGQRIHLRGKIGPVLRSRSAEHPLGNITVRPLECSVEPIEEVPTKPADSPQAEVANAIEGKNGRDE